MPFESLPVWLNVVIVFSTVAGIIVLSLCGDVGGGGEGYGGWE